MPWVPAGPCGVCWAPAPHSVLLLSAGSALRQGGLCQWCPLWEGVLGTTWSLKPPWCSPVPRLPPLACSGPTGLGSLCICGSETPTELHPSECCLLLARLELKG